MTRIPLRAAAANPLFGGIVAHGYLVVSLAAGLFVDPAPGPVLANFGVDNLRFLTPVKADDSLTVTLTAKQITPRQNADYGEVRWDAVVTTKRHNVPEIVARGAKHVTFVLSAYDPAWHQPCAARTTRRYLVGFIGSRRPDRAPMLHRLARRYRDEMYLAGPGWQRDPVVLGSAAKVAGAQYGQDLSIAIAPVTANLVLLNSDNRDTHTCRTFEVPAAGGLFVGERTPEHSELLDDGTEALLFSDEDEMQEQLARCRSNPDEAAAIAAAGYRRIVDGGHRYVDRAREIVADVC